MSFGILAVRKRKTGEDGGEGRGDDAWEIALVRRRHSIALCELMYGTTALTKHSLRRLGSQLTNSELALVRYGTAEAIDVALNSKNVAGLSRKQQRRSAWRRRYVNRRFTTIRASKKLLKALGTETRFSEPEWELPKGRKLSRSEKTIDCAVREFAEETGYSDTHISLLSSDPLIEQYESTNGTTYVNVYYLATMNTTGAPVFDPVNNLGQTFEISAVQWVSPEEAIHMMRNTQATKVACIREAMHYFRRQCGSSSMDKNITK